MIRATVVWLVDRPKKRGVFDAEVTTERKVYAVISSVGMRESYHAMANGLRPDYRFKLAISEEYQGEPKLKYNGKLYNIIRTYVTDDGGIELTVERDEEDA